MLYRAQNGVENQDSENDDGALRIAGDGRDQSGDDEDDHHQVLELLQKDLRGGLAFAFCQGVFSVAVQTLRRLGGGEASPAGL